MISVNVNPKVEKANEILHRANVHIYKTWLQTMVFSWRWWALVLLAICFLIIWIVWKNKNLTFRLLYTGFFVALATFYMDSIGMALGLWSYPMKDIPLMPSYFAWDFCIIPVAAMLTIQYKPKANPVIKAIKLAILGAFIVQPIASLVGYYQMKHWRHSYSFPLVIIIYLLGYYFYNGRTWGVPGKY